MPQFLNLSKEQRNESFARRPVSEARFYGSQRVPLRKKEEQRAKKQDTRLRPAESRKKACSQSFFRLPIASLSPGASASLRLHSNPDPFFSCLAFAALATLSSSSPLGKNKSETQNNS